MTNVSVVVFADRYTPQQYELSKRTGEQWNEDDEGLGVTYQTEDFVRTNVS